MFHEIEKRIQQRSNEAQTVFGIIAGITIVALMLLTSADVFGRYVLLKPIPGAKEVGQLMMAGLTYFGLGYALIKGTHIRLTFLPDKLNLRARLYMGLFTTFLGFAFFVIHTYGSWQVFWDSFVIREAMYATISLPWWVGKLFVFIGVAFITGQFLVHLLLRKV